MIDEVNQAKKLDLQGLERAGREVAPRRRRED